jgi:ADP-ribosylglycohydrolase
VKTTKSFHAAIVDAINRGEDADTVGAVTGMIAGSIYGLGSTTHPRHVTNYSIINEALLNLCRHAANN